MLVDDEAQVGDDVVLLGDGIYAEDLAEWAGTNEYEVLTNISARVPRVYALANGRMCAILLKR